VQRFRGGLVFKAHRLCVSLNSRLESNKEEEGVASCHSRPSRCQRRFCFGKVDIRLPGKGNSNSYGARPVHLIIAMLKWIRTNRLPIKNSLSLAQPLGWRGATPFSATTSPQIRINSPFSVHGFVLALAGIRRLVVQIKAIEKVDLLSRCRARFCRARQRERRL